MAKKKLSDETKVVELTLAKYKAVLAKFPDASLGKTWEYNNRDFTATFSSKAVNTQYNKLDFDVDARRITAIPHYELKLTHNDEEHIVKVNSTPKSSRLVYIPWRDKVIKFSRLSFNLKNNDFVFTDDMLNACRVQIMQFIQTHPGYKLDEKYLEPRLKKLLLFT